MINKNLKNLEVEGCKVFVCPNLNLIDIKGKELGLSEEAIKESKDLAITYLKKTYHHPKYSSIKKVLPSFIYITGILRGQGDRRTQHEVANVFGCTAANVRRWYMKIANELSLTFKWGDNGRSKSNSNKR